MNTIDPDHLINVLTAVRKITRIIISEKNADKLIKRVCQSLFESRQYLSAWILLLDKDGNYLKSAEAGLGYHFEPLKQQLISGEYSLCVLNVLSKRKLHVTPINHKSCKICTLTNEIDIKQRKSHQSFYLLNI